MTLPRPTPPAGASTGAPGDAHPAEPANDDGGAPVSVDDRRAGWRDDRRTAPAKPLPGPPPGVPERRARHVGWRSRDIIRGTAIVLAVWAFARMLWFASSLVFVVFLGTLFGLAVGAAVDRLERFRIRRGIASALVVFSTLGALVGAGALMAPTLAEQFGVLRRQIPAALDRAERWVNEHQSGLIGTAIRSMTGGGAAAPSVADSARRATSVAAGDTAAARTARAAADAAARATPDAVQGGAPSATDNLKARVGAQLSGAVKYLFPFLSSTLAVVGGLVLIIFLAIYIGAEPKLYHDGLMHLFPHRARKRTGEVLTEMAVVLRKWLVVQLIAMVVIGTVTTVAMLLLKVKAAYALGFIAGLLEFIPTVGPILSALPAIAMGFVDGPEKAAAVVLAYWGIQFLENNLLIPWLMRGGMDLPPALTLVAQALMTLVFGFLGLMVAVPLTAAALVPIKMLYVRDVVGDDMPLMSDGGPDDDEGDDAY